MIRILLVDDDMLAIEGIAQNIDWQALGVEACFCATSARQAKQIIREKNISIVITDIEMPEESGLELVEWINDNMKNVVSIILTSYGDFGYTSRALRLRSNDYLLKPAPYKEVEAAVCRAVARLGQLQQRELSSRYATYWNDSLPALREQFWYEVVSGLMPQDEGYIARQAQRRHIPYTGQPARLIRFELPDIASICWEQDLVDVAMKNILSEVFGHPSNSPIVMHLSGNNYFALIDRSFTDEQLPAMCRETVNVLESLFNGTLMCVIGGLAAPRALRAQTTRLLDSGFSEAESDLVCVHGDRGSTFKNEMTRWIEGMADGRYSQVLQEIQAYLCQTNLRQNQLIQLHKSLTWKLYQIINQKQLDTTRFFSDEQLMNLSTAANQSAEGLLRWLEWMLRRLTEEDPDTKDATVAQIQEYIKAHLSEDLNRESIAAITFLSVDYISHLFTQKTGQRLSDYITSQRIEKAKKLLTATTLPVAKVAIEVGYNNISYFSRLFKRETGVTPQKYRKDKGIK